MSSFIEISRIVSPTSETRITMGESGVTEQGVVRKGDESDGRLDDGQTAPETESRVVMFEPEDTKEAITRQVIAEMGNSSTAVWIKVAMDDESRMEEEEKGEVMDTSIDPKSEVQMEEEEKGEVMDTDIEPESEARMEEEEKGEVVDTSIDSESKPGHSNRPCSVQVQTGRMTEGNILDGDIKVTTAGPSMSLQTNQNIRSLQSVSRQLADVTDPATITPSQEFRPPAIAEHHEQAVHQSEGKQRDQNTYHLDADNIRRSGMAGDMFSNRNSQSPTNTYPRRSLKRRGSNSTLRGPVGISFLALFEAMVQFFVSVAGMEMSPFQFHDQMGAMDTTPTLEPGVVPEEHPASRYLDVDSLLRSEDNIIDGLFGTGWNGIRGRFQGQSSRLLRWRDDFAEGDLLALLGGNEEKPGSVRPMLLNLAEKLIDLTEYQMKKERMDSKLQDAAKNLESWVVKCKELTHIGRHCREQDDASSTMSDVSSTQSNTGADSATAVLSQLDWIDRDMDLLINMKLPSLFRMRNCFVRLKSPSRSSTKRLSFSNQEGSPFTRPQTRSQFRRPLHSPPPSGLVTGSKWSDSLPQALESHPYDFTLSNDYTRHFLPSHPGSALGYGSRSTSLVDLTAHNAIADHVRTGTLTREEDNTRRMKRTKSSSRSMNDWWTAVWDELSACRNQWKQARPPPNLVDYLDSSNQDDSSEPATPGTILLVVSSDPNVFVENTFKDLIARFEEQQRQQDIGRRDSTSGVPAANPVDGLTEAFSALKLSTLSNSLMFCTGVIATFRKRFPFVPHKAVEMVLYGTPGTEHLDDAAVVSNIHRLIESTDFVVALLVSLPDWVLHSNADELGESGSRSTQRLGQALGTALQICLMDEFWDSSVQLMSSLRHNSRITATAPTGSWGCGIDGLDLNRCRALSRYVLSQLHERIKDVKTIKISPQLLRYWESLQEVMDYVLISLNRLLGNISAQSVEEEDFDDKRLRLSVPAALSLPPAHLLFYYVKAEEGGEQPASPECNVDDETPQPKQQDTHDQTSSSDSEKMKKSQQRFDQPAIYTAQIGQDFVDIACTDLKAVTSR